MEVLTLPIDSIHVDPSNVRRHPARNISAIKASLARFGQQRPILVDAKDVVRAGNGTVEAARALGWTEIRAVRTGLKGSEATAYAIADNRTAELAEWEDVHLASTLQALKADDIDLDDIGFSAEEIDELIDRVADATDDEDEAEDPGAQVDHAEELLAKWGCEVGQLWSIGEHRLLCGDSTKSEDVARLMDGRVAVLMNTDPPYGVGYDTRELRDYKEKAFKRSKPTRGFDDVKNDDLDGRQIQSFLESAIRSAVPHLKPDAAFYLWHPMLTQGAFFAAAAAADILIHRQIIWVKPNFIFGRGDYHWQHELCFYGWIRGNRPQFYGERNQSTIWILDEGGGSIRKDQDHPTQKPVELFKRPILNHSRRGEVIYEPFAGSGSQFVAAEQTNRPCFGIEIVPKYVAVTLERLSGMGLEPKLVD